MDWLERETSRWLCIAIEIACKELVYPLSVVSKFLFFTLSTKLLLYKDGYYQIDGDLHTKLPGQVFTNLHSDLKSSRDNLKSEIELLKTTKSDISDLVSYDGSSHTSTVMNYNFLLNQLKNLDTSITQYESNHASQDLVAFKELLAATKALIAEHSDFIFWF